MVTHYLYLKTQFGEYRYMQFRVIVVTDPQTNKQTNKHSHKPTNIQDRLQYTAPLSLARHVTITDVGLLGTTLEANDSYRTATVQHFLSNSNTQRGTVYLKLSLPC